MGSWDFLNVLMGIFAVLMVVPVAAVIYARVRSPWRRVLGYAGLFLVTAGGMGLLMGIQSGYASVLSSGLLMSVLEFLLWQDNCRQHREQAIGDSLRQLADAIGAAPKQGKHHA